MPVPLIAGHDEGGPGADGALPSVAPGTCRVEAESDEEAATFSATGHPGAGRYVPVAFAADLLHLMATGLWLGGLVALAVLCTNEAAPPAAPPAAPAEAAEAASPFHPARLATHPLVAWHVSIALT